MRTFSGKGERGFVRFPNAMKQKNEWGEMVVHDDVLAAIVAQACLSVAGVVEMSQRGLGDNLTSWVGRELPGRGVRVTSLDDSHFSLELYVIMEFGRRIPEVARQIGQVVNARVYEAIGDYPERLVVHVQGVRMLPG